MRRIAIVIACAALAAGCRAGFPSLNQAPGAPPADLVAARDAAAAREAELRAAGPPADAPLEGTGPATPYRLLASLPVDAAAPAGVLDRAAKEARARGRGLLAYGVGAGGEAAAARIAARIRAAGVAVTVRAHTGADGAPGRVELYLTP